MLSALRSYRTVAFWLAMLFIAVKLFSAALLYAHIPHFSDPWATYRAAVVLFWIGKITPWLFALCVVADAWMLRDRTMMWVGAAIIAALAAVFADLILRHAL